MRIPDEQLALFEQRLQVLGLGRRDFLKVVGAMAAFGGLGFATQAEAAKSFKLAPARSSPRSRSCASVAEERGRTIRPATTTTRISTARVFHGCSRGSWCSTPTS